MHPPVANFL